MSVTVSQPSPQGAVQNAYTTVVGPAISVTGIYSNTTFTVTVTDTFGRLNTAVDGIDFNPLVLTGSYISLNRLLNRLHYRSLVAGGDTLNFAFTDSQNDYIPVVSLSLPILGGTAIQNPVIIAPASVGLAIGQSAVVSGISLSQTGAAASETYTVELSDATGTLSATGPGVSTAGPTHLFLTGSLSQVTAELTTVQDLMASPGSDTITVDATDSYGLHATTQTIAVSAAATPSVSAPSTLVLPIGQASAVSGLSIAEAGAFTGETFTANLSDPTGLLAATGPSVVGSGSTSLTVAGTLDQVNAALATLTDQASQSETLRITVQNSAGQTASASIGITRPVQTEAQLNAAIVAADQAAAGSGAITIELGSNIQLTGALEAFNVKSGVTVDLKGDGFLLDGQASERGLFVYSGAVTVENLTIENMVARGGNGAAGGGGGAGLGGGLFVADDTAHGAAPASVVLNDVAFVNDAARGGDGEARSNMPGGGGGMGGAGGAGSIFGYSYAQSTAGGGGGGLGGIGGQGFHVNQYFGSNFTGGGLPGGSGIVPGALGAGAGGLAGGGGGASAGGGGGGGYDAAGGGGGVGGGVGTGGFGGGGGGERFQGGHGGFGGGGGSANHYLLAAPSYGSGGYGGAGGFGGGGGAGVLGGHSNAYAGGFTYTSGGGGHGGFGGGAGSADGWRFAPSGAGGGGGLGAGGDIFVQQGASLTIGSGPSLGAGAVAGGSGASGGSAGRAYGATVFLQGSGSLTFATPAGQTQTVSGVADTTGSHDASGQTGAGSLIMAGAGELILGAENTFTGGVTIDSGTVDLAVPGGAGPGTISFAGSAATLVIPNPAVFANTLSGLVVGDRIDLLNTAADAVTYIGSGQYSVTNAGAAVLTFTAISSGARFTTQSDGAGGTDLVVSQTFPGQALSQAAAVVKAASPQAVAISGLSLTQDGVLGPFTVTVSDKVGLLSATGAGVSGSGTTALTITGDFTQVNADLVTLTDANSVPGFDPITVTETDGFIRTVTETVGVEVYGALTLSSPSTVYVAQGQVRTIGAVGLSEGGAATGETFSVVLSDSSGLLSATGAGVSGTGTTQLTLTGSITDVNSELASVTAQEGSVGPIVDAITLTATDSFGQSSAPRTISVNESGPPMIAAPPTTIISVPNTAIAGVSLSEALAFNSETFTASLTDANGLLSATGPGVSGAGTTSLAITGSLAQVNAGLATLKDTNAVSDTITLSASDSLGQAAPSQHIAVTAVDQVSIAAPTELDLLPGSATTLAIDLGQSNEPSSAVLTATLSDTNALLSATGEGVSGAGTTSLTITGSLANLETALSTLTVADSVVGTDALSVEVSDNGGASASATIAIVAGGATSETALNGLIARANQAAANSGAITVYLAASFALTGPLQAISLQPGVTLDIEGRGFTLDGGGSQAGFVVSSGAVALSDLSLQNMKAQGAAGGGGSAGQPGLGAGLYVGAGAAVTVSSVNFTADSALGGAGGTGNAAHGGNPGAAGGGSAGGFGQGGDGGQGGEYGVSGQTGGSGGGFGAGGGGAGGANGPLVHLFFGDTAAGGGGGGGGGGLGAGGDIFVQSGGALTIAGATQAQGSAGGGPGGGGGAGGAFATSRGSPGAPGAAGQGYGGAIFLQGSQTLTFSPAQGATTTISGVIADTAGTGAGQTGAGALLMNGAGTLVFSAANIFTGGITLDSGTLDLAANGAAGSGAITFAGSAATLAIANPAGFTNTLSQIVAGDRIDLLNTAADTVTFVGSGHYAVTNAGASVLNFTAASSLVYFSTQSDGAGGTYLLATAAPPPPSLIQTPAPLTVPEFTTPIAGVSLVGSPLESFTVNLSDTNGLLSATGSGVIGSGSQNLTLTGTLAEVNAELATLTDTDMAAGADTITVTASDGFGRAAPSRTIAVTARSLPFIATGGRPHLVQATPTTIGGVSLSESGLIGGESFTVVLSDTAGLLSATGGGVSGAGTTQLTVAGSLAQVNASLASLTDTSGAPGQDTITLQATDSYGQTGAAASLPVTTSGPPTITAPAAANLAAQNAPITGLSLTELAAFDGETFTVSLSGASGLLSATGPGVTGSGTTSLTLSGSLDQVNADLATLSDTATALGSNPILVTAVDSLGQTAAAHQISMTTVQHPVTSAPSVADLPVGLATSVAGVTLIQSQEPGGSVLTVTLSDTNGLLSATGPGVGGAGTTSLTVTGSLVQVDAALATLSLTEPVLGADTVSIAVADNGGQSTSTSIAVVGGIVNSEALLNHDIALADQAAANSGTITVALTGSLALNGPLQAISLRPGVTLDIEGRGFTLDGGGSQQGLVVSAGTVTLNNLTLQNLTAQGATGYFGSGGKAGLGGALFVGAAANVTVNSVTFQADSAVGGSGQRGFDADSNYGGGQGQSAAGFGGGGGGGGGAQVRGADRTSGSRVGFGAGAGGDGGYGGDYLYSQYYPFSTAGGGGGGGGGGALGAGGDIYVQSGGALTIGGASSAAQGIASGGQGGVGGYGGTTYLYGEPSSGNPGFDGASGQGDGGGLFLQGNETLSINPGLGQTTTLSGVIADMAGSQGGQVGAGSLLMTGAGALVLSAANTFTGGITLDSGTVELASTGAAGSGGVTFAGGAATLQVDAAVLPGIGGTFGTEIQGFASGDVISIAGSGWTEQIANVGGTDVITTTGTPAVSVVVAPQADGGIKLGVQAYIPPIPAAPAISGVVGQSLNDADIEVRGTGVIGDTVAIYADGGTTAIGTGVVATDGTFDILTTTGFADGTHTLTATQSLNGYTSAVSTALPVAVDPLAPSLNPGGPFVQGQAMTITGNGETGAAVSLYDAGSLVGSGTVAGDGTFSISGLTLLAGLHNLTATETQNGATSSASTSASVTVKPPGQTYLLTTGQDIINGGPGDNTIDVGNNTLTLTDQISAGLGSNTLVLQGGGGFNLAAPSALTGIATIQAQEGQYAYGLIARTRQLVLLRDGQSAVVNVTSNIPINPANPNIAGISIQGAHDSDVINLGGGSDIVNVGSAAETVNGGGGAATINVTADTVGAQIRGAGGPMSLNISGGGAVSLNASDTGITALNLNASSSAYALTVNSEANLVISDRSATSDTITGVVASDTVNIGSASVLVRTATVNAGVKVIGGAGTSVLELLADGASSPEAAVLNAGTRAVEVKLDEATILVLSNGVTNVLGSGMGDTLSVASANIASKTSLVETSGANSLTLRGGGTFNLAAPTALTGFGTIAASEGQRASAAIGPTYQTLILRSGLNAQVNVASASQVIGNVNPVGVTITGATNDSSRINLGDGVDVVTLGSSTETVHGGRGTDTVNATAGTAGALITGAAGGSLTVAITGGGAIVLNTADSGISVVLRNAAAAYSVNTGSASGLTIIDQSATADVLTSGGAGQTLTGGAAGKLTMVASSQGGDIFVETAYHLNGDTIKNFAGAAGNEIDVTDIGFSKTTATFTENAAATQGQLKLTDGAHTTTVALFGQFAAAGFTGSAASAGFTLAPDNKGASPGSGVLVTWHG